MRAAQAGESAAFQVWFKVRGQLVPPATWQPCLPVLFILQCSTLFNPRDPGRYVHACARVLAGGGGSAQGQGQGKGKGRPTAAAARCAPRSPPAGESSLARMPLCQYLRCALGCVLPAA